MPVEKTKVHPISRKACGVSEDNIKKLVCLLPIVWKAAKAKVKKYREISQGAQFDTFEHGTVYYDKETKKKVEFQYMGQTNLAIVCEPGDSGGGMQSCWAIDPARLQTVPD